MEQLRTLLRAVKERLRLFHGCSEAHIWAPGGGHRPPQLLAVDREGFLQLREGLGAREDVHVLPL